LNENTPATPFPYVTYYAKTAYIEWDKIGKRYDELVNNTIGTITPNTFPTYTIWVKDKTADFELKDGITVTKDTLSTYVECPTAITAVNINGKRIISSEVYGNDGIIKSKQSVPGVTNWSLSTGQYVKLTPGLNKLGYSIVGWNSAVLYPNSTARIPLFIDFKWMNVNYVPSTTVTDADGNSYATVSIGTQVWMASNLKTTKFRDGSAIPFVKDANSWLSIIPGNSACCWYNDAETNKATYGALYNWFTVNTGKLCPTGWHVPTDTEWTTLATYLGGGLIAGEKMKETGTSHWYSPNSGTNSSGFTALPDGYRNYVGQFMHLGSDGFWWSSTESSTTYAWEREIFFNSRDLYRNSNNDKRNGYSVRCLRD
jgi:uncharacterized protein (TIGR02145 family)